MEENDKIKKEPESVTFVTFLQIIKKMASTVTKWIILIIGVLICGSATYLAVLLLVYSIEIVLIWIILLALVLLFWYGLWWLKLLNKKYYIILVSFVTFCSIAIFIGQDIYHDYIDSIPELIESNYRLEDYSPFAENTKAVKLNEPSTLKIEHNLPVIDGATALYPLYAAFIQATYPQKDYVLGKSEVDVGTTPAAYRNLMEGKADIIFCAAPSKEQVTEADSLGKTFRMIPIGREAFVFFVNKKNPVKELTTQQIRDIYSGKTTNWKQLGGNNDEIQAYQRPKNSGSQTMLEEIMGDTPLVNAEITAHSMGDIFTYTANYKNYKNAIGYSFLFFATEMVQDEQIQILKIDGVYPGRTTIKNCEYPFTGDFYAITTDTENENVEKLIEWILSPQGQYLVEKTGYIPVN